MNWMYLYAAGLMEIVGVVLLKQTVEARKYKALLWLALSAVMAASFYLLSLSLSSIPTGTAYAIWTGIGSVGSVLVGMLLFRETYNASKLLYLTAILVGIVGLRLTS